jgi:hypothetical protein
MSCASTPDYWGGKQKELNSQSKTKSMSGGKKVTFEQVNNTYRPSLMHHGGLPRDITQELSVFVNNSCSIDAVKNLEDGSSTCFNRNQLLKIVHEYNKKYPNNKIVGYSNAGKQQLWNLINDKLNHQCNGTEWCWLDQDFLSNSSEKYSLESQFKPRGPKGPNDWLSTSNISNAMRMYEKIYRGSFKFFGPVPIDFDSLFTEIKNISITKLYNRGVRKLGFVFNLDPSHKGGSHWVAMYVDIEGGGVYYFDSYATSMGCPPKEIIVLKDRIMEGLRKLYASQGIRREPVYEYNKIRFQRGNSECGVYSMYFVLQMARGRTFKDVTEAILLDEEIQKFRSVYFRPKYK